jgi:hypothetical protein
MGTVLKGFKAVIVKKMGVFSGLSGKSKRKNGSAASFQGD